MITSLNVDAVQIETKRRSLNTKQFYSNTLKRLFDLLVSLFVTVFVLSWFIPVLGAVIKLTSPGPIIYVQWRTGRRGRPFKCYKLRTMYNSARNATFKQATLNDSRVTAIGRWLRRTNLDEVPQFFNVLLGQMSLVGPRPHAIQHDAEYWTMLPDYPRRYEVIPGITGLAQVRGARGVTDNTLKMHHRLRYDLHYIKRRSLLLDIKICWWTIKPMFTGKTNAW